jgi:predicted DNA-binding transcriptional regulator AlpA
MPALTGAAAYGAANGSKGQRRSRGDAQSWLISLVRPMTELLNTAEAAAFLSLKCSTLESWRSLRLGPPFVKLGRRCVRYRRADLEIWLAKNVIEPKAT